MSDRERGIGWNCRKGGKASLNDFIKKTLIALAVIVVIQRTPSLFSVMMTGPHV